MKVYKGLILNLIFYACFGNVLGIQKLSTKKQQAKYRLLNLTRIRYNQQHIIDLYQYKFMRHSQLAATIKLRGKIQNLIFHFVCQNQHTNLANK